ncbi:hypothetical protein F9U64_13370 [Gracilibacillus oryzae]|uniref:Cxxc_20_cxxc protein n=1 Tax=Gracilibacillus oryzae TaxID=1672701 RepID=A0A7C8GSK8_9BACI|nr:hypothetical protein F9U64_13370 [Gracilibacillus oryzae]
MGLPKCVHCHTKFRWKLIFHSFVFAYHPVKCENCLKENKVKLSSRFLVAFLLVFILYTVGFSSMALSPDLMSTLIIMMITGGLFLFVCPFIVRYR